MSKGTEAFWEFGAKNCLFRGFASSQSSERVSLRKHAYSNILKISPSTNENFQIKNSDICIHISAVNIDCGYSSEPPRRGGSNEYPQSMFWSRNKKNNVYPCKHQFYYIKVGVKGVQNYLGVFSWCDLPAWLWETEKWIFFGFTFLFDYLYNNHVIFITLLQKKSTFWQSVDELKSVYRFVWFQGAGIHSK